jgi:hypothetical protein
MKSFLRLPLFVGILAVFVTSCANHQGEAIVKVLNARNSALVRSEDGKGHGLNFVEYTAALQTIDTAGCPQKFLLAWQEYVRVISSKRGFGILVGGPQDITLAESQVEEAASDSGVKFNLPNSP